MVVLFWTLMFVFWYCCCGYALLLIILCLIRRHPVQPASEHLPAVSLIIASYNEERMIRRKIENSLRLNYPRDKLEIIVFSDGSTDRTDEIVKEYAAQGIRLFRFEGRKGKTYCNNEAVKLSNGEIIVFSDANSIYEPRAIRHLVRYFSNSAVGCVSGELRYRSEKRVVEGEAIYWNYEQFIKRLESGIGSLTTANGALYAVRRDAWDPLPEKVIDDFGTSLRIRQKGFLVLYEPEAVAWERTTKNTQAEYRRRVRMVRRAAYSLLCEPSLRDLLNPYKYGLLSIQLWSHKILRWLSGFILIVLFILNIPLILQGWVYAITMAGQLLFYTFALWGYLWEEKLKIKAPRPAHISYFFFLSCVAMLQGFYYGILGNTQVSWTPNRF